MLKTRMGAMLTPPLLERIVDLLQQREQEPIGDYATRPVSGGDINTSYLLTTKRRNYFIKTLSQPDAPAMHAAEADGLQALAQVKSLVVPEVLAVDGCGATSFLVLGELTLGAKADWRALGRALADLHQLTWSQYGWPQDNFIGSSRQRNMYHSRWSTFWWQRRLLPQLELTYNNGFGSELKRHVQSLQRASDELLQHHRFEPALVHGDLWGGNVGFVDGSRPTIFDPACYYGDREVDLAMSRLFGGFGEDFYGAYEAAWPLPAGHEQRATLYNLYHLLNHLNLFGGGYLPQCLQSIQQLAVE